MGRFRVKQVKSIPKGYIGMNPLSAEAIGIKHYPRRTFEVVASERGKKGILRHEQFEYGLLKKVKEEKGRVTKQDYLKAHRQTIHSGHP